MTLFERFRAKYCVDPKTGCWIWIASEKGNGYGQFSDAEGRVRSAHRVAYELFIGAIPEGLQIDHLCRNRACVNPSHMEPVTNKENTLRGVGFAAVNAAKTHCAAGHPYSADNTYVTSLGHRQCRECRRIFDKSRVRASRSRRAEAA